MTRPVVAKPGFYGYPEIREGPDVAYRNTENVNPIFRGVPLVVSSWVVSQVDFIQKYLWGNAGFGTLRGIEDLSRYNTRYEPAVVPISTGPAPPTSTYTDTKSFKSLPQGTAGRFYSIADFHAAYISGELTPLQVAKSLIPLISRNAEPRSLHSIAFTDTKIQLVLESAEASTERYKNGKSLGILDGVPVGIKDEINVAGYRTYYGRKQDDTIFPLFDESEWPVKQWQEAGAVVMGKLSMHELGCDTTNNNPHWGTPRNPYNRNYYTGGSSGGSAYAVAAGLFPITFGADAGGSIRLPAANCGIYGLKPSQARIGETGLTVCVVGPLAASISDLEVAYRVMATPNPSIPISSLFSPPKPHVGPRSKIMGIYEPWFNRADPQVQKRCRSAIDYMVHVLDYKVIPIQIPYLAEGQLAHAMTTLTEMASILKTNFPGRPWLKDLTASSKVFVVVGSQTSGNDYLLALRMRSLLMSHLAYLFEQHPGLVIVTPTSPLAGWKIAQEGDLDYGVSDGNTSIRNMEYVWLANFTGCPSISCPAGYATPEEGSGDGDLPVGLMALGDWGSEDLLIEWGRDVEGWLNDGYEGGRRRPANWEDVLGNAKEFKEAPGLALS